MLLWFVLAGQVFFLLSPATQDLIRYAAGRAFDLQWFLLHLCGKTQYPHVARSTFDARELVDFLWYCCGTTPHPSITQREFQAREAALRARIAFREATLRAQAVDNEAVHRNRAADVEARAADLQRRLTAAQRENQTRQAHQRRLIIGEAELKTRLARCRADMGILQQRLDRATERLTYIEGTAQGDTAREWEKTMRWMHNRTEQHEKMITRRDETIINLRADAARMQGEIRTVNDRARTAVERVRRLEAHELQWRRTEQRMRNENQQLTNQGQTMYTETQTLIANIQNLMTEGQRLFASHQQLQRLSNQQAQGCALLDRIVDVLHELGNRNDRESAYVAVGFAAALQAAGVDVRMLRISEQRLEFLKDLIRLAMDRQSRGFHGRSGVFRLTF